MMSTLHSLTFVITVLSVLLVLTQSRPAYNDVQDSDYLQMLNNLQQAKEQGNLGQLYDQLYDGYDYPDSTYQDYINELLRRQEWQRNMQQYEDYGAPEEAEPIMDLEVLSSWPAKRLAIGQVAGVAVDRDGNPHIFHRADRVWGNGKRLFDQNYQYLHKDEGPIEDATVLQLSQDDGSVIKEWGKNRFYLPHGLTIDSDGNFWLTDVALHQVFKFEPGKQEPSLVLGEAFQPAADNQDSQRFCQPTDVAVSSEGDVFVADGYCNRRIAKFDASGNMVGQIPLRGDPRSVPHSIVLAEDNDLDLVCVADREERSILCFNAGLNEPDMFGKFEREYTDPDIGRIFAIEYNQETGLLHAVTDDSGAQHATGFTIDLRQESDAADLIDEWSPYNTGFSSPHDVAVSPDGNTVYVGETKPNLIWKFENTATQEGMELEPEEQEEEEVDENEEHEAENSEVEEGDQSDIGEEAGHEDDLKESNDDDSDLENAEQDAETEETAEEEGQDKYHRGEELEQELEKEEQQLMDAGKEQD